MNRISDAQCIEKSETSVSIEFSVPKASDYFNGHFPGFPILPAVAQVDIVMRYVSEYFNVDAVLSEIKRIKFTGLVRPHAPLVLSIKKNGNIITFKMNSPDDEIVYSAGTLILGQEKTSMFKGNSN